MLALATFITNILEAIGVSLVIPVFQQLLEEKSSSGKFNLYIDYLFNFVSVERSVQNIVIGLVFIFFIRAVVAIWAKNLTVTISADFLFDNQKRLLKNLLESRIELYSKEKQGALVNAITQENVRAANAFVFLCMWATSILTAVAYASIAILLSGKLAVLAVLFGILSLLPLKLVTRKTKMFGTRFTQASEEMQNHLIEIFSGIKYIKSSALEEHVFKSFADAAKKYKESWYGTASISNTVTIYAQPIAVLVLSIILIVGKTLELAVAEIIVFLIAFQRLMPTLSYAQSLKNDFESYMPGQKKVEDMIEKSLMYKEKSGSNIIPHFNNEILIDNVSFSYNQNVKVLENVNIKIRSKSITTFLGHSGSGKSTLVDLLLGFHSPISGRISVDGVDLNEINLLDWRKQIAYVTQDTFLFHDTIKNNIIVGVDHPTDEELLKVAKVSHSHEFINNFEDKYEAIVGDRGCKLSGGQKQRIALARAIMRKPKILILDEATSALDYESENLIKESIEQLKEEGMTIIIIAHRLTTVKMSDMIYILDSGTVSEFGVWETLLKKEGSFINRSLKLN